MFNTIECTQLDFDDTTFLMSYPLTSPSVTASVGTVGVIHPIVLSGCACHGKYQIVMGFRRAYACRELGIPIVNACVSQIDPENPAASFFLALHENLSHRQFNDVEKSLILTKLLNQFECSEDEVLRKYMPSLGLATNKKVLESYLNIASFGEEIKQYLAGHDVSMTVIDLLSKLSEEERQAVFDLISGLKLGTNKIKELLGYLEEITLRDGSTIQEVLRKPDIQDILHHEKYSTPQKAEQIRRMLRELRYPEFTALDREYHTRLKALPTPNGVRLTTDKFFEDDKLSATFSFQKPEQLKHIAEKLQILSEQPELQHILNLIQGKDEA